MTGRGTLGEERYGSEDPRGGAGGRWTLGEVRDMLEDPQAGPERVWGPWERSGTAWGTLGEVRDGSGTRWNVWDGLGYLPGDPRRVGRSLWRSGTGCETLPEVRDGLKDPRAGLGQVRGTS